MPIFGITASSNQSIKLTNFFSIATTTVGAGGTADVTFSNIPQTYTHLQLRMMVKNHTANTNSTRIQFNSDTGANYSDHYLIGTGSTITSSASTSGSSIYLGNHPSNAVASIFAGFIVDIVDYKNTNKYKTIKNLGGYDLNNTDGRLNFTSGNWRNTNAITTIRIYPGADSFAQYSTFALYGVL